MDQNYSRNSGQATVGAESGQLDAVCVSDDSADEIGAAQKANSAAGIGSCGARGTIGPIGCRLLPLIE